MDLTDLVLLSLASFRITRLLVFDRITKFLRAPFFVEVEEINEDGEKELFYVPKKTLIRGFIGEMLSCFWCTGIWISMMVFLSFTLFPTITVPILLIFAIAGLAGILESVVQILINK